VKIGILMLRHPPTRKSPIIPEVIHLLREWGITVDLIYPEEQLADLKKVQVKHDFYIIKSGTDLSLSLAGALHASKAITLNPYPITLMMRNKIFATHRLTVAGIPTPETYVTSQVEQLAPLLEKGPLIIKPFTHCNGQGVHVVWDHDGLGRISPNQGPIFAQRYYSPQGKDHKIYYINGQIFGVKRVWPARTYEEKIGKPFTISSTLRQIALRCSRAFGIELLGFDVIFSEGRPYVVDINCFPGFKGVPNAALRLADFIYSYGQRVLNGKVEQHNFKEVIQS
jgi:ribosomal protein S6--L-glutamate ligase